MRLSIRQKLADKMERMEKRGSYLCERNKEESCPLSFSSFFFFIYRSRKIKLWSGLRPQRIRNDGWSGTNDSPVCDGCFTRTSFEYNSARLDSFDIFLQHTLSPPFYPVASCKFRFCSRWEILETRFIRFVGGWCKCPKITFPRLLRKLDGFKIHYPKSGVTNSDNTSLLLVSERKTIRKTNLT